MTLPALLTTISTRPHALTAASTAAWPPSTVDTSLELAIAVPPALMISSATSCAGAGVVPGPLGAAAEVVDHHPGAALAEQQRVGPADAASRAGDDRDPAVEVECGHWSLSPAPGKNPA